VSVVSEAVLILILAMRMRGRVYEAGILLSVGIPKREILGQFVAEVTVIAIIAFACAYSASGFVAVKVENGILENLQVVQIEQQALETGLTGNAAPSTLLTMPFVTTALVYASLLAAIILSAYLSSLAIFKLKPREIFAQMS
jgi:ABC-type antimicrobial peptide transport system permease subunit